MEQREILTIRNMSKIFPIQRGFFKKVVGHVHAVNNVDLTVYAGETLGLVGESGCGKTTLGKCLLNLLPVTRGEVRLHSSTGATYAVEALKRTDMKAYRKAIQFLFQDPYSSLNPRMTVYDILHEPIVLLGSEEEKKNAHEIIERVFVQVGLKRELLSRYPHSFSGGQRQRISMARSLVLRPEIVVADEPVSALDVSIQAQILNLFKELQANFGLTYIFISHDLAVIRYVCDRIAVMYLGSIVEIGETEAVLATPAHPYTQLLINSIPKGDGTLLTAHLAEGEVPDPINLPSGCPFHTRCPYCSERCRLEEPTLCETADGRQVKCHHALVEMKEETS